MADISDNIAICVFTFIHSRTHYNFFNTTDIKALMNGLHYSGGDKELHVNRPLILKSENGKEKKYIIKDIIVHYYGSRILNRELIGEKSEYNVQVMVYVDDAE